MFSKLMLQREQASRSRQENIGLQSHWLDVGIEYFNNREFSNASTWLETSLGVDVDGQLTARAYALKLKCDNQLRRYQKTLDNFNENFLRQATEDQNKDAWFYYATAAFELKLYDRCLRIVDDAISKDIHDDRLYGLKGQIYYNNKHYSAARDAYFAASRLDNNWPNYHHSLGGCYCKLGAAESDIDIKKDYFEQAVAQYKRAITLHTNEQFKADARKALRVAENAVAVVKELQDIEIEEIAAKKRAVLRAQEEKERAALRVQEEKERKVAKTKTLYNEAVVCARKNEWRDAYDKIKEAEGLLDYYHPGLLFFMGMLQIKRENFKEALSDLDRAFTNKNNASKWLLDESPQPQQGENRFLLLWTSIKRAQNTLPQEYRFSEVEYYHAKGCAHARLGQYQQALKAYYKAHKLGLNSDAWKANKSILLTDTFQGQSSDRNAVFTGLLDYCTKKIKKHPEDTMYLLDRATLYHQIALNESDLVKCLTACKKGINDIEALINLSPSLHEAIDMLSTMNDTLTRIEKLQQDEKDKGNFIKADTALKAGKRLITQKQYELAIEELDKALKLNPSLRKAYKNRGIAKLETGQWAGAKTDFKYALRLGKSDTVLPYLIQLEQAWAKRTADVHHRQKALHYVNKTTSDQTSLKASIYQDIASNSIDYETTLAYIDKKIKKHPSNALWTKDKLSLQGFFEENQGRIKKDIVALLLTIKQDWDKHDSDKILPRYDALKKQYPLFPEPVIGLGFYLLALAQKEPIETIAMVYINKAQEYFRAVLRLDVKNTEAEQGLANIEKLLNPDLDEKLSRLKRQWSKECDVQHLVAHYENLYHTHNRAVKVLVAMGNFLMYCYAFNKQEGCFSQAVTTFNLALEQDPSNQDARNALDLNHKAKVR